MSIEHNQSELNTFTKPIDFLRDIERHDIATLLKYSSFKIVMREVWHDIETEHLTIYSPKKFNEALQSLQDHDKKIIIDSIKSTCFARGIEQVHLHNIEFALNESKVTSETDSLIADLFIQKNMMINVSTKNVPVNDVNDYYKARHRRICKILTEHNINNPNPHNDLWDWYNKWKDCFPTYAERRRYINEMFAPLLIQFANPSDKIITVREPTGWERVDRVSQRAKSELQKSSHEEQYQTVGLLCREIIISVAQAVYDEEKHSTSDGVKPSDTDGFRMIDAYITTECHGKANENIRKHAKASLSLAVELQHKRTADFRLAALCLEATSSVVNILAILSGKRDKPSGSE